MLVTAWKLLAPSGPRPTVQMVADAAGLSLATVYRSFSSRNELYAAAFAYGMCAELETVVNELSGVEHPVGALRHLARAQVEVAAQHVAELSSLPGWIDAFLEEFLARFEIPVQAAMHRAQRSGELRADLEEDDIGGVTRLFLGGLAQTSQPLARAYRYIDLWFDAVTLPATTRPAGVPST